MQKILTPLLFSIALIPAGCDEQMPLMQQRSFEPSGHSSLPLPNKPPLPKETECIKFRPQYVVPWQIECMKSIPAEPSP